MKVVSASRIIAMIPARAGSKRVTGKNIKTLAGHPVMAYTISAAIQSGIFSAVLVSTDSEEYAKIASYYGAEVPFLRPIEFAGDLSPDIEWLDFTLRRLMEMGRTYDCFSILRPTSPFRLPETIQRAWKEFQAEAGVDSLRAVEKCKQHPGKMWVLRGQRMFPLLTIAPENPPWHSTPYQALPVVYVQNASLEIAWTRVVLKENSIAGNILMPFLTQGYEGYDVNTSYDWAYAEELVRNGQARLPEITRQPYPG
jgi:CMP-N,N'-diacetyllegionaminic acid synthase